MRLKEIFPFRASFSIINHCRHISSGPGSQTTGTGQVTFWHIFLQGDTCGRQALLSGVTAVNVKSIFGFHHAIIFYVFLPHLLPFPHSKLLPN